MTDPARAPTLSGGRPSTARLDSPGLGATLLVLLVVVLAVFAGISGILIRPWSPPPTGPNPSSLPIRHVVIVMMENRAFDNLFGSYCPTAGPGCPTAVNGFPPHTCVPYAPTDPSLGCIRPYPVASDTVSTPDISHEWNSTHQAIDGGAMDGFYYAEQGSLIPFGYYNATTIPLYYDLAQEYGLGESFFSSALSYSLPNHWYLLAGQAPRLSVNVSTLQTAYEKETYLSEANGTRTVQDLLNATPSVSWKYYDWILANYSRAIAGHPGASDGSAYDYWNPLAARAESYSSWYASHFVARSQFFPDASSGQLPNISYVIPSLAFSDHAPAVLANGQAFVASIVDAVEASPEWNSTAVFISWDDYGGFFDHVAPPMIDALGLSFRVPLLVVSPYTPKGVVVNTLGYFDSLLHFVEWRFGLGCLTVRDCHAPLPLDYFDFRLAPRAPMLFPTSAVNASYPMSPLADGGGVVALSVGDGTGCSIFCVNPRSWDIGPAPPDTPVDVLD
jgi:phospholipase C